MSKIKNLLKSVLDKDGTEFKSHLNNIVTDRISDHLEYRKQEISTTLLHKENKKEEIDESVYTFKNTSDVKKFVSAATEAGIKKNLMKVKGKTVDVKGIKDKDMIGMLNLVAKDMKGTVSESISSILDTDEGDVIVFEDGSVRFVTSEEANILSEIHDSLNSNEREDFIKKISESSSIIEILLNCSNDGREE
tara:strand:+ start:707 stop:1282 length:576 start_codon:yes stop_codon:yes gene_type:complete